MRENILYILGEGGGRIPSKFIQQLKVGSGKEVATVHAAENGRKVSHQSISSHFALKKTIPGGDRVSGKDLHTQPQSDKKDGRRRRQRGNLEKDQKDDKTENDSTIKKTKLNYTACQCDPKATISFIVIFLVGIKVLNNNL